jgi:hypothetical protein
MGAVADLDGWRVGETLRLTVSAREQDGTALASPDTATLSFVVGPPRLGPVLLSFDAAPQIVLTDAVESIWTVSLSPVDLAPLGWGIAYRYDIWSDQGAVRLHQIGGTLYLQPSVLPL